jgi:hypothetical protein
LEYTGKIQVNYLLPVLQGRFTQITCVAYASIVDENVYVTKFLSDIAWILVCTWDTSAKSTEKAFAVTPAAVAVAATCSNFSCERLTKATSIPAFAKAKAVALPMPVLAPVIRARRFCSTLMVSPNFLAVL